MRGAPELDIMPEVLRQVTKVELGEDRRDEGKWEVYEEVVCGSSTRIPAPAQNRRGARNLLKQVGEVILRPEEIKSRPKVAGKANCDCRSAQ